MRFLDRSFGNNAISVKGMATKWRGNILYFQADGCTMRRCIRWGIEVRAGFSSVRERL